MAADVEVVLQPRDDLDFPTKNVLEFAFNLERPSLRCHTAEFKVDVRSSAPATPWAIWTLIKKAHLYCNERLILSYIDPRLIKLRLALIAEQLVNPLNLTNLTFTLVTIPLTILFPCLQDLLLFDPRVRAQVILELDTSPEIEFGAASLHLVGAPASEIVPLTLLSFSTHQCYPGFGSSSYLVLPATLVNSRDIEEVVVGTFPHPAEVRLGTDILKFEHVLDTFLYTLTVPPAEEPRAWSLWNLFGGAMPSRSHIMVNDSHDITRVDMCVSYKFMLAL